LKPFLGLHAEAFADDMNDDDVLPQILVEDVEFDTKLREVADDSGIGDVFEGGFGGVNPRRVLDGFLKVPKNGTFTGSCAT
jgi:hypothetical protein